MTWLRDEFLDWVKDQPKGKSHRTLAKEFGINRGTVGQFLGDLSLPELPESKMDIRNKYKNVLREMLDANGVKCGKQRFEIFKWKDVPNSGKSINQIYDELIEHIDFQIKKKLAENTLAKQNKNK